MSVDESLEPLDSHAALQAAVDRAEGYWRAGDSATALRHYRHIASSRLSRAHAAGKSLEASDAIVLERLADLSVLHGHIDRADELFARLATLLGRSGNTFASAYMTLKRVQVALARADLRGVGELLTGMRDDIGDVHRIQFAEPSLMAWENSCRWLGVGSGDRTVLFSRLYLAMGKLLAGLGQYREAEVALRRGLRAHATPNAPDLARRARVPLELALASVLLESGELDRSNALALGLAGQIDPRWDTGHAAERIELLGRVALLRGDLGAALEQLGAVHELCRSHGLQRAGLHARLNLAHALVLMNQTSRATELARAAEEEARTLSDAATGRRATAIRLVAHARSRSLGGGVRIASSVVDLRNGVVPTAADPVRIDDVPPLELPQSTEFLTFFDDRALAFHWLLAHRRFDEAGGYLERLWQMFGRTDSRLILARLGLLDGLLAYYRGATEVAERQLTATVPALRAIGLTGDLWQAQRVLGWCWKQLGRPAAEQQRLQAECATALDRMTASLNGAERTLFLLNKWTADEEKLASEIDALVTARRVLDAGSALLRPFRRWSLTRRLSRLIDDIDRYKDHRTSDAIGDRTGATTARRPVLRWLMSHPRDRTTIGFLVLPDRVLVTRSSWLRLDFGICPLTRVQVRELVRAWYAGLTSSEAGLGESEVLSAAARLAEELQIPQIVAELPARVRHLTFVPDDSLHGFPFTCLPNRDEYLVQHYTVRIAFEHAESAARPADTPPCGLLVGVSQGAHGQPRLRGVHKELRQIAGTFDGAGLPYTTLLESAATREHVIAQLNRATLAHIAAHGDFVAEQPDRSGVVLGSPSGHTEILSLRDLAGQMVHAPRHVTLASCWSADQFVLPGRWVISIPETLWRGGVGSVLASLWEINDRFSLAFMERFYGYAMNHPVDVALQRTQIDCLAGRLPGISAQSSRDPRLWGSLTLYGSSTSVPLARISR